MTMVQHASPVVQKVYNDYLTLKIANADFWWDLFNSVKLRLSSNEQGRYNLLEYTPHEIILNLWDWSDFSIEQTTLLQNPPDDFCDQFEFDEIVNVFWQSYERKSSLHENVCLKCAETTNEKFHSRYSTHKMDLFDNFLIFLNEKHNWCEKCLKNPLFTIIMDKW